MIRGSFNKIIIVKNFVIKIENVIDSYSLNILSDMDNNHRKYYNDLKNIGIDVPKLYLDIKVFGKNIEIQEYIEGYNLGDFMEDKEISIDIKLKFFKELLLLYKKTNLVDVCLDLNMNNYIICDDKLIYIDLIPAIYKSKINSDDIEKDEYKNYYLNNNLALSNLINYFLRSNINLSKSNLNKLLGEIRNLVFELFDFDIDLSKNKKSNLISNYISSDMDIMSYENTYQKIKRI